MLVTESKSYSRKYKIVYPIIGCSKEIIIVLSAHGVVMMQSQVILGTPYPDMFIEPSQISNHALTDLRIKELNLQSKDVMLV